ncbi:hypothetical protein ONZ45_g1344 [Pleurotus djamor]|nr:hypothetical protein ONZ45_g1344 [Pleurotus djamor]
MSPEITTRKKRSTESNPAPDGDHRKRRRNRTTQSCLNCHTSKRMCDRKRPACARCTQLGLTGLCVYEVDDPSQRSESQDESSRLLKRVAELEGVIRELKNKPHPRWVQAASVAANEEFDRWHSRTTARLGDGLELPSNASSPPSSSSSDGGDSSSSSHAPLSNLYPTPHLSQDHSYYSSPGSTPSPSTLTPTEEFSRPLISIAGHDVPHDFDLNTWFSSYPGIMGCDDGSFGPLTKEDQRGDSSFIKQQGGHCGCLHEPANYNVVLELSLRLRKAADVLARSPSHRMGSNCVLHHRIAELDTFATNTLGNISTPPEDLPSSIPTPERPHSETLSTNVVPATAVYNVCRPGAASLSPNSLSSLRTWDMLPTATEAAPDDSFMSWEPPRRG